jgi:hypothetical protein
LKKKLQALRIVMAFEDNWKLRMLNETEIMSLLILQLDCGTHFDKRFFLRPVLIPSDFYQVLGSKITLVSLFILWRDDFMIFIVTCFGSNL